MAVFEVDVNGKTYEIDAPDAQTAASEGEKLKTQALPSGSLNAQPINDGLAQPRTFAQGAADILSFGLSDEIAAGLGTVGGMLPGGHGKGYDELLSEIRGQQKAEAAEFPKTHMAGQVSGAVAPIIAGFGPAVVGAEAAPAIASTAPTSVKAALGMGAGGFQGGAYGFGSGEGGYENRMRQAVPAALIGAALGAAIPTVAAGASSAYRNVADALARNKAARVSGVEPEVANLLRNTLQADDALGPRGMANMQRAGQEAMIADTGPAAQNLLDVAVQKSGPGSVIAREALEGRVARGSEDLNTALNTAMGEPVGIGSARREIASSTATARGNAYGSAYAKPIDYASEQGQKLENLVKGRVPKSAIDAANQLMRVNGEKSEQIIAHLDDAGNVTGFEMLPDVRQLDYITRGLNYVAEAEKGKGGLGGQTALGSAYGNLSRELRSTLRDAVPEYGHALDTAADPLSRSQMVKLGSEIFSKTRDDIAHATNGISVAERDALATGIRGQIDERVANVTRTLQDGNTDAREAIKALKDLSSRASREKITAAIGEDRAAPLFDELDRISTTFDLRSRVREGSQTFVRTSTDQTVKEMTAPGAIGTAMKGEPLNAAKRLAQVITGQTPERLNAREQEIYAQIADFLTRPAAQATQRFNAMNDYAAQEALNQVMADRIRRFGAAGRSLAYPATSLTEKTRR